MTHFADDNTPGRTLCGQVWEGYVGSPKARCTACENIWAKRTGWSFPLPEVVA